MRFRRYHIHHPNLDHRHSCTLLHGLRDWWAQDGMEAVDAAMAELPDDAEPSLNERLLGTAWMSVASEYILKRSRLRQNVARKEESRKKRKGGWHPKPRQYLFWERPPTASKAQLWEHDHSQCKLWRWLRVYSDQDRCGYEEKQFREQFGVPRDVYHHYYDLLKNVHGIGDKVKGDKLKGRRSKPLKLKLLAWLLWMREGLTFKRAAYLSDMDANTFRRFAKKLNNWLVMNEYHKHVHMPAGDDIPRVMAKFQKLGFPGAITTADGVHVAWENCPASERHLNTGKEGYPTRVFNCCVGPNREFTHVHGSHPGARNDKTIARFDPVFSALRTGTLYHDQRFTLRTRDPKPKSTN